MGYYSESLGERAGGDLMMAVRGFLMVAELIVVVCLMMDTMEAMDLLRYFVDCCYMDYIRSTEDYRHTLLSFSLFF